MKKMNLIVAMDEDGGIGKDGKLPWTLKKDMQYFAAVTKRVNDHSKRNAVLMGRKCWESIPERYHPLPGRLNIVLSRQLPERISDDLVVVNSIHSAFKILSEPPFVDKIETIWNIGGAEIYDLALRENLVDEIYVTRILDKFNADVHLNSLHSMIKKLETSEISSENSEIFEEKFHEKILRFQFKRWKIAGVNGEDFA